MTVRNGPPRRAVFRAMQSFLIKAEPLDANGRPAVAVVIAEDPEQALLLLRKDIDFSGYRLPPAEMVSYEASHAEIRRVLGETATHEIGVYGFRVLGSQRGQDWQTPPQAVS